MTNPRPRVVEKPAKPGTDAWRQLITASKIPAILGVSRYQSQYSLWHEMAGNLPPAPISEARQDDFDFGHAVELAAREYWRLKNPRWRISQKEVQYTDESLEFGNAATIDRRASLGTRRRVVEVKKARDVNEFGDDGSGEVPIDHAAQVTYQQRITGFHEPANLILWPEYGRPRIYVVEYSPALAAHILATVRKWVASLAAGTPPDLDDSVTCYETVKRLHPEIDGREVEVDPEIAIPFLRRVAEEKALTKDLRGSKARMLDAMGTAETALCMGQKIATRYVWRGDTIALKANPKTDPAFIEELTA